MAVYIGNPNIFFNSLGINIQYTKFLKDNHKFKEEYSQNVPNLEIVDMTYNNAIKCKGFADMAVFGCFFRKFQYCINIKKSYDNLSVNK